VACWSTKATISLKCVKIEEKLLWRGYRNSPTLFRTVPSPTPYGLPFPRIGRTSRRRQRRKKTPLHHNTRSKIAVTTYRALNGSAPTYLSSYFTRVTDVPSRRRLRSASSSQLAIPRSTFPPSENGLFQFPAPTSGTVFHHTLHAHRRSRYSGSVSRHFSSTCHIRT